MSRFSAVSVLVLSICVAALALPALAQACSCAGPGSEDEIGPYYAERIKDADGAVIARVTKIRYVDGPGSGPFDDEAIFTVRVRRAFKRLNAFPKGREVRVHTAPNGAACGLELGTGDVAGLLLYRQRGGWQGNLCGQISPSWMRKGAAALQGLRKVFANASAGCAGTGAAA